MIDIFKAIRTLDPSIITIRGDVAYDKDENIVEYDKAQAEAKLVELKEAEAAVQAAKQAANDSANAKLKKLGLTDDEISALKGTL